MRFRNWYNLQLEAEVSARQSWVCDSLIWAFHHIDQRRGIIRMIDDMDRRLQIKQKAGDFAQNTGATGAAQKLKSVASPAASSMATGARFAGKSIVATDRLVGGSHFLALCLVGVPDLLVDWIIAAIQCMRGNCSKEAIWKATYNLFLKAPTSLGILSAAKLAFFMNAPLTVISAGVFASWAYWLLLETMKKIKNPYMQMLYKAVALPMPERFLNPIPSGKVTT